MPEQDFRELGTEAARIIRKAFIGLAIIAAIVIIALLSEGAAFIQSPGIH